MRARSILLAGAMLGAVLVLGACGGSSSTVAVTITPTTATVALGATQQFTSVVTGTDTTTVTWMVNSVSGGNSTVGKISTEGLYTAPANALNVSAVTVTATSTYDTSKSASATVTINSGAKVTVEPSEGITLAVGESYQFTDSVTNTANAASSTAVYWLVNDVQGGGSTTGSITQTGLYTAPSYVGSSTTYVVKATLQADSGSYGTTKVTVVPAGSASLSTLNPSTVPQGSPTETVFVYGTGFTGQSKVRVDGDDGVATTTFISTNLLAATLPGKVLNSAGTRYLDVEQQSGALSSVVRLTVKATAPALISTSPDSIAAGTGSLGLTLDGGYFGGGTEVAFNGNASAVTVTSTDNYPQQANVSTPIPSAPGLYAVSARNSALPTALAGSNVAVRATATPTVLSTLTVGSAPMSVAVNPATGIAVVANSGNKTISVIDLNPNHGSAYLTKIATLTVGTSPCAVAIDNLRNYALVVNNGDATVSVVDLSTPSAPSIKATISSGLEVRPFAIGVNSLTGKALLVYQGSAKASILDLSTLAVSDTAQIPTTGDNPQVAVDTRLNWAIVTPGGGDTSSAVAVVDLARGGLTVVSPIAVPSSNGAKRSSGTVTITATVAHDLKAGETVVIAGVNDSSFNGTFTVASVTSSTSFTYSQSGSDATSGNGTVSAAAPLVTIYLDRDMRGLAINSETETAVFADPSSASLSFMSLLDQSVKTLTLETGMVATAVSPLTNTALVANAYGNTLSIVDLKTFNLSDTPARTNTISIPGKPVSVAIDPVTDLAITANQTNGTVTILDIGSLRSLQVVQMSPFSTLTSTTAQTLTIIGHGFATGSVVRFSETALNTTYVSERQLTAVIPTSLLSSPARYVVDVLNPDGSQSNVNAFTVMQAIGVGTSPRGVAIDRMRRLAVVANSGSKNVSILNLDTLATVGTVTVGNSPQGVALSSVKGRAAVTNTEDDTVTVIDLDNIAVASTVSVAPSSGTAKPVGIAVHPGTGQVVIAQTNNSLVSTFSISSPATPSTLTVDAGPNAVAIDPVRNIAAVSETTSGQVVFVDLATFQILDRVSGFSLPTGVVYVPDPDPSSEVDSSSASYWNWDCFLITASTANNFGIVKADPSSGTYAIGSFQRVGINPTSIDYNYRSSTLVTTNTSSQTMSIMDFQTKKVKALLPLSVGQQFAVTIDPDTNRAVVVDQANNRVLIVPLP